MTGSNDVPPSATSSSSCFYICPIGEADSDARKRSNQIYEYVVRDALVPMGYTLTRADQMEQSGLITSQIIEGLTSSDLVVADLTDHNANVFYELAIRHAVGKPFVQLMAEHQTLPFDIQGLRTVFLDHRDLDSVKAAKITLTGMVESMRDGKAVETPLTYAINLRALQQSEDSEARGIVDILAEMQNLRRIIESPGPSSSSTRNRVNDDIIGYQTFIETMLHFKLIGADHLELFETSTLASPELKAWATALRLRTDTSGG